MLTDRKTVVSALRAQGEHDRALQASCQLPQHVDTDQDAAVLRQLGVDVSSLDQRV
jgi:hypothetical protein